MKIYSIGRETGCDIVINDNTDVISRRHATLNVSSTGKMTIVDQSHNGTYVNGMRIQPNVPYPVTRKDTVSLAHVAKLDWNRVPSEGLPMRYIGIGAGVAVVIVAILICVSALFNSRNTGPAPAAVPAQPADSTTIKKEDKNSETDCRTEKKDSSTAAKPKHEEKKPTTGGKPAAGAKPKQNDKKDPQPKKPKKNNSEKKDSARQWR